MPVGRDANPSNEFANVHEGTGDAVRCLQLRGEYMFVAEGKGGFRVYDVASIANKGVSERIITAPFSALGHDTHVKTKNATCMALPTNQPVRPDRNKAMAETVVKDAAGDPVLNPDGSPMTLLQVNQEQAFQPIYDYAVITDADEGLILVNVDTMADGEFRNNQLKRALTWNRRRCAGRRAAYHAGGRHRLYHRRQGAGGGRSRPIRWHRS